MMAPLSLQAIAAACTGEWAQGHRPPASATVMNVTTDSRRCRAGDLFIALRGERFDAHDFLADVQAAGATAAVVDTARPDITLPQLCVADTVQALGQIASLNRQRFSGKVIGLTGSAGKTTTKEMIAAILAVHGQPLVTEGNLNNHIGVPLTLLQLAPEHDSAVIEMGASAVGDIAYLTSLTQPDVALVTTVAPAHLEGFGSIANVASGKSEIFAGLPANGVAIINLDNPWTAAWTERLAAQYRTLGYSLEHPADVRATAIRNTAQGMAFDLSYRNTSMPVHLQFLGAHNVGNAVAAAACCLALGMALDTIVTGLEQARPYKGRLQRRTGKQGCQVIDDTYNANPASVQMAIQALRECPGQHVLVLGDMAELGSDARPLHHRIGQQAREAGISRLLATGELSRATVDGFGNGARHYPDWESLREACLAMATADTVFLVKGSRSARMERIADALADTAPISHGEPAC